MSARNDPPVNEVGAHDSPETGDMAAWDTMSQAGSSERPGGRDHGIGLAVAGITLAALLVGGLVAFVIARAG